MGEPAVSPTYCPINGAYSFTYSSSSSSSNGEEKKCEAHTSEIADCPYGFGLDLKFKGCSFGSMGKIYRLFKKWNYSISPQKNTESYI